MSQAQPIAQKPWYRRVPWWGWVAGVVVLLVIGGIYNAVNPREPGVQEAAPTAPTAPTATSAASPTPSAVPETQTPVPETPPPAEPEEPTAPALADAVWAQVLANFPDGITSGSPLFAVTGVEDVTPGTIRVFVQETLTDDGRAEVARHVFNMGGGMDSTDLEVVVVRDASGVDSNHYRRDFPYLPH